MEKIVITIKPTEIVVRNELHFNTQLRTRSNVFRDRKRAMKRGYVKHKGGMYE